MAKYTGVIIGGLEIAVGVVLTVVTGGMAAPIGVALIISGAGMLTAGIVSAVTQGQLGGTTTTLRNPIAPWGVIYGRSCTGGTLIFQNSWGESDKYLDMVIALACHPCESVDALLFDKQRVNMVPSPMKGCSQSPRQATVNISRIQRQNSLLTVWLGGDIPDLQPGDYLILKNIGGDKTLNGKFVVQAIVSRDNGQLVIQILSGGANVDISGSGEVVTAWPDYRAKIYCEVLDGTQPLGMTFAGMTGGTPYDGDWGNLVVNGSNPWNSSCSCVGRCVAFLRLHYNDEVFANGLPQISWLVRGKNDIADPRTSGAAGGATILLHPSTSLNGWAGNGHAGPYELGQDQGNNWGLNGESTSPFADADSACDVDVSTCASISLQHTHHYAGCIWSFGAGSSAQQLFLSVLFEIPTSSIITGRSAAVWYSLDGGTTWKMLFSGAAHPKRWEFVGIPAGQDQSQLQVMAFIDSHDDMALNVYEIQLANVPAEGSGGGGSSSPGAMTRAYSENAALCIADYLCNSDYGFGYGYGSNLPLDKLIAAANICDELVELASGQTEPRYACNGRFDLSMSRGEILRDLLSSCGGRLSHYAGEIIIWPAAWPGLGAWPSTGGYSDVGNGKSLYIGTSPEPANWASAGFDDAAWTSWIDAAPSLNAYGEGFHYLNTPPLPGTRFVCDATQPDGQAAGAATLFRYAFVASEPSAFTLQVAALFSVLAVYMNGKEVFSAAPLGTAGAITYPAISVDIPADAVQAGQNVLAIKVGTTVWANLTPAPIAVDFSLAPDSMNLMMGRIQYRPLVSVTELVNGVKGTYMSPANQWQSSDFPFYAQDYDHGWSTMAGHDINLDADNGERRWLDIALRFTISAATAQRLAKIELMRRRYMGRATLQLGLAGLQLTPMDVFQMSLSFFGWGGKILEVQERRLRLQPASNPEAGVVPLVEIDVQETGSDIYDWNAAREEMTPQGGPDGTGAGANLAPDPPQNFTLESDASTIFIDASALAHSRILCTWTPITDGFVVNGGHLELRYCDVSAIPSSWTGSDPPWMGLTTIQPFVSSYYITGVVDMDEYAVEIRCVNAAGVPSAWVSASVTVFNIASLLFLVNGQ